MTDSIIQLPYVGTTSGDILDASSLTVGALTVKRERMIIGNDTSSHVAIVTTSGALTVVRTTAVSLSSNPTVNISSGVVTLGASLITLPVAPVDAITAAYQPITTSGGGLVTVSSQSYLVRSLSSGTVTLSSAIGVSSGLITLTGTNVVTNASSGFVQVYQSTSPWSITGVVTNASSGLVQVLQSTGAWAVTGGGSTAVTVIGSTGTASVVTSAGSNTVSIVSSGGIFAPVTSSAGLLVNASITGGAGSTTVNIQGSTGVLAIVTSGGALEVAIVSQGGVNAPVTSSYGLQVTMFSTRATFGTLNTSAGAPVTKQLTTAAITVFTLILASTGTAGNFVGIHTATSALSTNTPVLSLATFPGTVTANFIRGIPFATGLFMTNALTAGSTATNTSGAYLTVEYEI
jgi:hypothetical protein